MGSLQNFSNSFFQMYVGKGFFKKYIQKAPPSPKYVLPSPKPTNPKHINKKRTSTPTGYHLRTPYNKATGKTTLMGPTSHLTKTYLSYFVGMIHPQIFLYSTSTTFVLFSCQKHKQKQDQLGNQKHDYISCLALQLFKLMIYLTCQMAEIYCLCSWNFLAKCSVLD